LGSLGQSLAVVNSARRAAGAEPRRILIVQPDDALRDLLVLALLDGGYTPVALASVAAALEVVRRSPPVAVVLDTWPLVRHPNGETAAAQALSEEAVPIVTLGDWPGEVEHLGAAAHLIKPFDLDDLLATLAQFTAS
jgi:two-component system response regulator MprA